MTDIKLQENSMRSQSQSCLNSKYLRFVSRRGAFLDAGSDISSFLIIILLEYSFCEIIFRRDRSLAVLALGIVKVRLAVFDVKIAWV